MKTGDYLGNAAAQLSYISTNYTFVARDMAVQGMNVIAQSVAAKDDSRFQDELVALAKAHGKLAIDHEVPECYRYNLPEVLEAKLHP